MCITLRYRYACVVCMHAYIVLLYAYVINIRVLYNSRWIVLSATQPSTWSGVPPIWIDENTSHLLSFTGVSLSHQKIDFSCFHLYVMTRMIFVQNWMFAKLSKYYHHYCTVKRAGKALQIFILANACSFLKAKCTYKQSVCYCYGWLWLRVGDRLRTCTKM